MSLKPAETRTVGEHAPVLEWSEANRGWLVACDACQHMGRQRGSHFSRTKRMAAQVASSHRIAASEFDGTGMGA